MANTEPTPPPPPPHTAPSHWQRLDPARWNKLWLWVAVTVLTTGVPATLQSLWRKWVEDAAMLGFDKLFFSTAPLLLSVAAVSFLYRRGALSDGGGPYLAGGIVLLGGWIGHWCGGIGAVEPLDWLPTDRHGLVGQIVFAAVNQIAGYVSKFGIASSLAAFLVGHVLGCKWAEWSSRLGARKVESGERGGVSPPMPCEDTGSDNSPRRAA